MRYPNGGGLETRLDHASRTLWIYLPASPSVLTSDLLDSFRQLYAETGLWPSTGSRDVSSFYGATRQVVLTARSSTVFTLGADLAFVSELVRRRDRDALLAYATACLDAFYPLIVGFERGVTTISLVRGKVLSLGVDLALSCSHVFVERNAVFGVPELLYNCMPGVAAFSLLDRRVGSITAERFLRSARLYWADELEQLRVVDELVDVGAGEAAVREFITGQERMKGGVAAFNRVRNRHMQASYDALRENARQWADAASAMDEKDLRNMERYMRSQGRWIGCEESERRVGGP